MSERAEKTKSPFKQNNMFATPETMDDLMFNQEQFSGPEAFAFTMGMMLTWNYMSQQFQEWLDE